MLCLNMMHQISGVKRFYAVPTTCNKFFAFLALRELGILCNRENSDMGNCKERDLRVSRDPLVGKEV